MSNRHMESLNVDHGTSGCSIVMVGNLSNAYRGPGTRFGPPVEEGTGKHSGLASLGSISRFCRRQVCPTPSINVLIQFATIVAINTIAVCPLCPHIITNRERRSPREEEPDNVDIHMNLVPGCDGMVSKMQFSVLTPCRWPADDNTYNDNITSLLPDVSRQCPPKNPDHRDTNPLSVPGSCQHSNPLILYRIHQLDRFVPG